MYQTQGHGRLLLCRMLGNLVGGPALHSRDYTAHRLQDSCAAMHDGCVPRARVGLPAVFDLTLTICPASCLRIQGEAALSKPASEQEQQGSLSCAGVWHRHINGHVDLCEPCISWCSWMGAGCSMAVTGQLQQQGEPGTQLVMLTQPVVLRFPALAAWPRPPVFGTLLAISGSMHATGSQACMGALLPALADSVYYGRGHLTRGCSSQ